mmetsp:Transcript_73169/g.131773  ORF Transcript_73169/g.131773 Transcript_73169/m.131773 type:complete len:95 (-) Transcript_73169:39-323(-)
MQSVCCDHSELRDKLAELGVIEAIMEAMKEHPRAANVQAFAASALQSLACNNLENTRKIRKMKLLELVEQAMEAHPKSVKLQEFGSMLIETIES